MASLMQRPHMIAFTIEVKSISDASFATSVTAIPIENPTFAVFRAGPSFVPSPVTPTISPSKRRVSARIFFVFRRRAGQHLETWDNLGVVVWIESTEDRAFHDDTFCGVDTTLSSD